MQLLGGPKHSFALPLFILGGRRPSWPPTFYASGSRIIIPKQGRDKLLEELHQCQPEMVGMKSLTRSYMWWPGLDKDIENKVKSCEECQQQSKSPALAQLNPFEFPNQPWYRIHIDHAELEGKTILIIIDAHSKYVDAHIVPSTSSSHTIRKLSYNMYCVIQLCCIIYIVLYNICGIVHCVLCPTICVVLYNCLA